MGQGDPGRRHQAAGMKSPLKIGKTFHNVSFRESLSTYRRHCSHAPTRGSNSGPFCCSALGRFWHKADVRACPLFVRF
jgi:hypothetical protein